MGLIQALLFADTEEQTTRICCRDQRSNALLARGSGNMCRHCHQRSISRPRGLCWPCFSDPEIRVRYPELKAGSGNRGVGDHCLQDRSLPLPEPTSATPGSPDKVEILAQRAARGERLWHPRDTRFDEYDSNIVECDLDRIADRSRERAASR